MENLRNNHNPSIRGVFTPYIRKKFFCSYGFRISAILAAGIFAFLFFFFEADYYNILVKIIDANISIFPSLLGFCVGGYALIIGFGHKDTLEKMSEPNEKKSNMSFFQIMSSTFAASVIILIIAFLASYFISQLINLELVSANKLLCKTVNVSAISLVLFLSFYSIILIFYMVLNIFTFGQMMHFCIRNKK